MCVEDYMKEFEMFMMRCKLREPQEQTIARVLGGLNKEISDAVELQPYVFLEDVIKLAVKVERQKKRSPTRSLAPRPIIGKPTTWGGQKGEGSNSSKQVSSAKEKEKMVDSKPFKKSRDIKCFKCLGHGHIASECPNKKVMFIWEEEIESEEEEVMEGEDEFVQED